MNSKFMVLRKGKSSNFHEIKIKSDSESVSMTQMYQLASSFFKYSSYIWSQSICKKFESQKLHLYIMYKI